jgi:hypothetical protein
MTMYLEALDKGTSRYKAKSVFERWALSPSFAIRLGRMYDKYFVRAKAFFPDTGTQELTGLRWLKSVIGDKAELLLRFNHFCLENQVNCIFCNRYTILDFKKKLAAKKIPHNNESINVKAFDLDSG